MIDTAHFHPMVIHFPIALILLGFLVELASWIFKKEGWLSKASLMLLLLGTLGAVASYLSGEFFTDSLSGEAGLLKEKHETFAQFTLWVMVAISILAVYMKFAKKEITSLRVIKLVAWAGGTGLVGYTGYLGGTLVLNYLIGL